MSMVGGLDLHRGQITFDVAVPRPGRCGRAGSGVPTVNGSGVGCGSRWPSGRGARRWRWRWRAAPGGGMWPRRSVAGWAAHVAEPADTQAARGRKHHAKTDRTDARLLRELLAAGELPESWIPPEGVLEWRERVRLYKNLVDQRTQWTQRIHAELFQHGVGLPAGEIRSPATREVLTDPPAVSSRAARRADRGRLRHDRRHRTLALPLRAELTRFGQHQPACRALVAAHFGIGGLTAVAIWSELGDCRRFSRSMQAVRHAGLDVTVDASDRHRGGGLPVAAKARPRSRSWWSPMSTASHQPSSRSASLAAAERVGSSGRMSHTTIGGSYR